MSDIKMSDVFHNGRISADLDEGSIIENGYHIFTGGCKYKAQAIATAVVSHDALVEQNKALKTLLLETKSIIESSSAITDTVWFNDHTTMCDKIALTLEQTK